MQLDHTTPLSAGRIIYFLILTFACSLGVLAQEKPNQRQVVTFPGLGDVEITAWQRDKDVPRIVFKRSKTGELIREIKYSEIIDGDEWWEIDKSSAARSPSIQFRILRFPQIQGPVVFVTGAFYGGSDGTLQTYLIAEVKGKLRVINTEPFISSYQGGTFVGNLGKKYGFGAIVWNFIWQDGFAHYATHPYNIQLYGFDSKTGEFEPVRKLTTRKLYYYGTNPTGPLREFGIAGRDLLETLPGLRDRRQW